MFKSVWVTLLRPLRSGWAVAFLLILVAGFAAGTVASGEPGTPLDSTVPATTAETSVTSTAQEPTTVDTSPAVPVTTTEPAGSEASEPDTDHSKTSTSGPTATSPEPAASTVPTPVVDKSLTTKHDNFDNDDHQDVISGPLTISGTGEAGTAHSCVLPRSKARGRHGRHRSDKPPTVTWEVQGGPFDVASVSELPIGTPFVPETTEAGQFMRCSIAVKRYHHGPSVVLRSTALRIISAPSFTDPDEDVSLSGDGRIGVPVRCTAPAVSGFPEPGIAFVWMKLGDGQQYVEIGSGPEFTPTTAQAGEQIFCGVRISNALGETTKYSRIMLFVSGPAISVGAPSVEVDSPGQSGQTLTCNEGDWDLQGELVYSYAYTWLLDGAEISDATARTFSPVEEGAYRCAVVVTNRRGASEPATSEALAVTLGKGDDELSSYYSTPPPPPPTGPITTAQQRAKSTSVTGSSTSSTVSVPPKIDEPEAVRKAKSEADEEPAEQAVLGVATESGLRDSPYGPVNAERSKVATSVPKPGDLDLDGEKVATGSLLALLMVALLGLPAAIFNETAERHHRLMAGWMDGPRALFGKLFGWLPLWGTTGGTLGASVLLTTGICAFLSPGFPTAQGSWQFLVGMLIGLTVIGFVFFATWHWYIKRFLPDAVGHWELYPLFAVVAVVVVIISRLAHFVPGVILGTIAEYEPSRPIGRMHAGRRVAITFGVMLLLALACWLVWIPISDQANVVGCSNVWLVLDAALSVGFVTGLETTVFGLLPLRFLDGHDLLAWNRWLWAGMWGLGVLWFSFVIADPAVSGYGKHTDSELPMLAGLLGMTTIIAAATWTLFYRRHRKIEALSDASHIE